jgi:alpha-beta hydrolase superfamily lysophospholipase
MSSKWKGDVIFLAVIGLLVGGWIYLYPAPTSGPLSPLKPPADLDTMALHTYASIEGIKLAYRLYEPPQDVDRVLVFLHDTLLHSGWYATMGQELAAQGIAVFLPDRRGWGQSGGDRQETAQDRSVLIQDITALIAVAQARYPQKEIFLGGHGQGAGLVMSYLSSQRPLPGVVLLSPYITPDQSNLNPEGWRKFVTAHPIEAFLAQSGLIDWRVWHYNWPRAMTDVDPLIETRSSIRWQQETVPDAPGAAYRSDVPLLCLEGEDDPLFYPDKTAELVARFSTSDRLLEIQPDADYLSVIETAAGPIARWLRAH